MISSFFLEKDRPHFSHIIFADRKKIFLLEFALDGFHKLAFKEMESRFTAK